MATVAVSVPSPATGTVQIAASAKGGSVTRLDISIDGVTTKTCNARECTTSWNTAVVSNGQHRVQATALLRSGQTVSSERFVIVSNSAGVSSPTTVPTPMADVVLTTLSLGASAITTGSSTPLTLTVSNRGAATADSVAVEISLTNGAATWSVADINVGMLSAGASGTVASTLTAPPSPGSYTVIATARTAAVEASTANNMTTATLAVTSLTTSTPVASPPPPTNCDFYASRAGGGTGLSQSSPFRIMDAWSVLTPGKTLCLLDGTYRGSASMISPTEQGMAVGMPSGQSGRPITIRALNDGKVLIDGQRVSRPVWLRGNSFITIEGINACCSGIAVIAFSSSANDNIFRRVGAWDAFDGGAGSGTNNHVWEISNSGRNLVEDSFGFGKGRYILITYDGGGRTGVDNTIRRFWARWEGYDSQMGPRAPLQVSYNSFRTLCENCIATWTGERQTAPWGCCSFGIGAGAPIPTSYPPGVRVLGAIGYVKAGANIPAISFLGPEAGGSYWTFKDTVVSIDPSITWVSPGDLYSCGTTPCTNNVAQNVTLIGGSPSTISSQWSTANARQCATASACGNVFTSATTANVCTRYVDGVKTTQPLWPWPMNQRILEATSDSGHSPENVTATMESLFGPIPVQCQQ